jgi:hypothetical protein
VRAIAWVVVDGLAEAANAERAFGAQAIGQIDAARSGRGNLFALTPNTHLPAAA